MYNFKHIFISCHFWCFFLFLLSSSLTSLESSSDVYIVLTGSEFFLLLALELLESFFDVGCLRPRPLPPRRPTAVVSSSAAKENKSLYCFWKFISRKLINRHYFWRINDSKCLPLCFLCYVYRRFAKLVAWYHVHINRCLCHDDNSFDNALNDLIPEKLFKYFLRLDARLKFIYFIYITILPISFNLLFIIEFSILSRYTWSADGVLFNAELPLSGLFLLFGDDEGYFDVNSDAIISDNFSSLRWHQNLQENYISIQNYILWDY